MQTLSSLPPESLDLPGNPMKGSLSTKWIAHRHVTSIQRRTSRAGTSSTPNPTRLSHGRIVSPIRSTLLPSFVHHARCAIPAGYLRYRRPWLPIACLRRPSSFTSPIQYSAAFDISSFASSLSALVRAASPRTCASNVYWSSAPWLMLRVGEGRNPFYFTPRLQSIRSIKWR